MTTSELETKHDALVNLLTGYGRVAVAFSAGVDSTLLLKVAAETLGEANVVAVTGRSDSVPDAELAEAKSLAETIGVRHVVIDTDEFEDESFLANPTNRCYVCRNNLFAHVQRFIESCGISTIIAGNNADDTSDFRPGLQAAKENGVKSPLMEAGLTKADIRALSTQLGLPTSDKPASPCLASRVPYGEKITPEKLRMIEAAEHYLRSLGHPICRVRAHDKLARIEVPAEEVARLAAPGVATELHNHFTSLGFQYVTLDLRGFRSGSLNEVVPLGDRRMTS